MAEEQKEPTAEPAPTRAGWQKVLRDHAGFQALCEQCGANLEFHQKGFSHAPGLMQPMDQARIFTGAREILDAHGYTVRGSHTPALSVEVTPREP